MPVAQHLHAIRYGTMVSLATDFDRRRQEMVDRQLRQRGIYDERVLAAMAEVPRHLFVPGHASQLAYLDRPLLIGHGQTISQPLMVAEMMQACELRADDVALDIGTGSGYQTAVLSRLVRHVYSVEIIPELAAGAREALDAAGYTNVTVRVGDGSRGWPEHAPYDAIVVGAGAPEVPAPLVDQLAVGGRLAIPVGHRYAQALVLVRRGAERVVTERVCACAFVPLIGELGWH